jgi:hypothetical protein
LIYSERIKTQSQAMGIEKQLKSWKNRKAIQHLIEAQLVESPMKSGLTTWPRWIGGLFRRARKQYYYISNSYLNFIV